MTDATLEAQREFLLRSLDDLDAERAAGDIDDETYERLRDDYTARAAAVVRALRDGGVGPPTLTAPVSEARRLLTVIGVLAFGVIAALVLASALGARLPGQTGSGNGQTVSEAERQRTLERAVRARPTDPQAQLALARFLTARQKLGPAFEHFDRAAQLAPADPEAQAYSGWLAYLAGLPDRALPRVDAAIAADEAYPDAHFFKGIILLRAKNDPTGAVPQFQRYLTLVPDGPLADQVRRLLTTAVAASSSTGGARP